MSKSCQRWGQPYASFAPHVGWMGRWGWSSSGTFSTTHSSPPYNPGLIYSRNANTTSSSLIIHPRYITAWYQLIGWKLRDMNGVLNGIRSGIPYAICTFSASIVGTCAEFSGMTPIECDCNGFLHLNYIFTSPPFFTPSLSHHSTLLLIGL